MRQLKYANLFTSMMPPDSSTTVDVDATVASAGADDGESEVARPRKRRSGYGAADSDHTSTSRFAQRRNTEVAEDSDIFSDALSEAEDSVGPEDAVIDYRRLHRASFTQRPPRPDFSFKVCIVGDVSVGKTTFLLSLTEGSPNSPIISGGARTPKVGIGGRDKIVFSSAKRRLAKCRLEDTAGQERYKSLTSSFYRNSFGCLIIYDVTREETFNHVDDWFRDVRMYAEAEISVVLVAAYSIGASDESQAAEMLASRRVVSAEEGAKKAEQFEVPYVEANVRKEADAMTALETLVDIMIDKLERRYAWGLVFTKRTGKHVLSCFANNVRVIALSLMISCVLFSTRRSQTPLPERYQSPDLRRSYRPSTVTRKSLVDIARANATKSAKPQSLLASSTPPIVQLATSSDQRDQEITSARTGSAYSCC